MMKNHFKLLVIGYLLCLSWPCAAHWQAGIELGSNFFHYQERSNSNERLNKESGLMPLLGVAGEVGLGKQFSLLGQWRSTVGTVKYDGQTQTGVAHKTKTKTRQQQWQLGLAWHVSDTSRLISSFGAYSRDRKIQAKGQVRGLDEYYSWHQLGVGLEQQLTKNTQLSLTTHWAFNAELEVSGLGISTIHLPNFIRYQLAYAWQFWQKDQHSLALMFDLHYHERTASSFVKSTQSGISFHEPAGKLAMLETSIRWQF